MKLRIGFDANVLAAFTAAGLVVAILAGITWKVANDATDAANRVAHTQSVINKLTSTRADTVQIELSTQTYRITGDPARLAERDATIASREILLSQIHQQTADNARQQTLWVSLRQVIDERLVIARRIEQLRKTQGMDAANAFVASAPLQETRARTYRTLTEMDVEERRTLDQRNAEQLGARQRMVAFGALASVLLLFMLSATYALIRRQLRDIRSSQRALAESEESIATTLYSIGDAVIATDLGGRISRMNPVAERLTGWSFPEAQGRPVEEVFCIVHEQTRRAADVPVAQVLATGEMHELANQTVLVARNGAEFPIADSAAPIRDAAGIIRGVVMVFRDETPVRQAKQTIRDQNRLLEQRVLERTAQLRLSEQRLERVLEGADQGYWDWDLQINAFRVSARWETMLGYSPGEMRVDTESWSQIVHPDDFQAATASIERHLGGQSAHHEVEFRARTKDGAWRWILTRGRVVSRADDGTPLVMSGTHTDVTERRQFEQAQRDASVVFENSYDGIMVVNADGLITKVNPAFTRITGYPESEALSCSPRILASGRHDARFYKEFWLSLTQRGFWRGEIWNKRKGGEVYAVLQSISAVHDSSGKLTHYVSVFADISQIKAHEAELNHVANYDALTDLPNRRLLSDRLMQSILRSDRSGKSCAICFLDLDGFKAMNDKFGHAVGDKLLVGIAEHLKVVLRAEDTLARLGGDEFVVLLSDVASTEECALILDRVLEAARQPVRAGGNVIALSASIGVSLYPSDNADPDILLRHADQAMYLAKQAGKNRYQLFDTEIDRVAQTHREYLTQMQVALVNNEFVLHYQPKVDLVNGEVVGAEALIRWNHPERGLLPPAEFLPHLNGSYLECLFGEWVIDTALNQVHLWNQQGLVIKVSVNVSANHLLQADFSDRLGHALAVHPEVAPSDLELEVLETAAIADMQVAVDLLHRCIALGVRFSLDDFGTGYSSLSYLRKLPVHTLKIDQSFVRDMLTDPDDLGIVKGVIELASVFRRQVVAEGAETLEHGAALRQLGCRVVQGYGIAKPMSAAQFPSWCLGWTQAEVWLSL